MYSSVIKQTIAQINILVTKDRLVSERFSKKIEIITGDKAPSKYPLRTTIS